MPSSLVLWARAFVSVVCIISGGDGVSGWWLSDRRGDRDVYERGTDCCSVQRGVCVIPYNYGDTLPGILLGLPSPCTCKPAPPPPPQCLPLSTKFDQMSDQSPVKNQT